MTEIVQKAADEKFCAECGAIIKAKAEICPKCGVRQFASPNSEIIELSVKSGVLGIEGYVVLLDDNVYEARVKNLRKRLDIANYKRIKRIKCRGNWGDTSPFNSFGANFPLLK